MATKTEVTAQTNDTANASMFVVEAEPEVFAAGSTSPEVRLNFVNQSNDMNNSDVVIFSRNVSTDFDEVAIAWTVIRNCGQGWNHPFTYPMTSQLGCSDAWGNHSPQLTACPGQRFAMTLDASGALLRLQGPANSPAEIELVNALPQGAVNAGIYKDGRLFALKSGIAPQQKAVFQFKPTIWIGVVSQIDEGQVMNSAIISDINTEISLLGVASADIVMTGGGPGANAQPFQFTLANVVMA